MAILKDVAQVLHVYETGNTSLVAVMLGRRLGQFRAHAKGWRRWPKKGFEGGLDLLVRGQVVVYPRAGENLWLLKEWDERARPAVGRSMALLRSGSYLCELTEALTRHTAGSVREENSGSDEAVTRAKLYDLLAEAAEALSNGSRPGALLLSFTLRALENEGLLPELDVCTECQSPLLKDTKGLKPVWLTGEGVRCGQCMQGVDVQNAGVAVQRGVWLSPEALRVLLHVQRSDKPVGVSAAAARQLAQALAVLVHGTLERDLRTLPGAMRLVAALGAR
ncbi:MAG TPA: DNA repair protein RecO C-terminal domain-containing protein [Planctomycetota bacterium]|jgi:recombinational DNA repair protein (RecF pathway)